jgi:hypothetical protein
MGGAAAGQGGGGTSAAGAAGAAGMSGSAPSGGSSGTGGSSGAAGGGGSAGGGVVPCDNDTAGDGIYVSPAGVQGANGSAATPVRSVNAAIELATVQKKSTIYLEEGAYGEGIVLGPSFGKPLLIDGGWRRINGKWTRLCGDAAATTTIQSPTGRALEVNNSPGLVRLRHLTLATAVDVPEPGRSHYALFAVGSVATPVSIDLEDVVLAPGGGEAGGAVGEAPKASLRSCEGRADCGSGATGGPGKNAATPAKGTFAASGYVAPVSASGGTGDPGQHGTISLSSAGTTYENCDLACAETSGACKTVQVGSKQVPGGTCGCGGEGGKGGPGGKPGGASVGLFAAGAATVKVLASRVRSANGGDGSDAGAPAKGAEGAAGKATPETCCSGVCTTAGASCAFASKNPCTDVRPALPAGGDGGDGGIGGPGAHGVGGPSICVVTQGGALANVGESVQLFPSAPGSSGPNGPTSDAKPFLNLP